MTGSDAERDRQVTEMVEAIAASRKYRHVARSVIRRIVQVETDHRGAGRQAEKAARAKLHQIGGAYLPRRLRLERELEGLREAVQSLDPETTRRACVEIMSRHASTRERIPDLEAFYSPIHEWAGAVGSVVDLACGLNPLAAPWMGFREDAVYHAYDMYADLTDFLAQALPLLGLRAKAEACDVLSLTPPPTDLALILKTLPCLEQLQPGCSHRLLDRIRAQRLVISYPTRSLGSRDKGMSATYERRFWELASGRPWQVDRLSLDSELVFMVAIKDSVSRPDQPGRPTWATRP